MREGAITIIINTSMSAVSALDHTHGSHARETPIERTAMVATAPGHHVLSHLVHSNMQLTLGLPPLWEESTLPVLKRVLDGKRYHRIIRHVFVCQSPSPCCVILHLVLRSPSRRPGWHSGLLLPQHYLVFSASGSYRLGKRPSIVLRITFPRVMLLMTAR